MRGCDSGTQQMWVLLCTCIVSQIDELSFNILLSVNNNLLRKQTSYDGNATARISEKNEP